MISDGSYQLQWHVHDLRRLQEFASTAWLRVLTSLCCEIFCYTIKLYVSQPQDGNHIDTRRPPSDLIMLGSSTVNKKDYWRSPD